MTKRCMAAKLELATLATIGDAAIFRAARVQFFDAQPCRIQVSRRKCGLRRWRPQEGNILVLPLLYAKDDLVRYASYVIGWKILFIVERSYANDGDDGA